MKTKVEDVKVGDRIELIGGECRTVAGILVVGPSLEFCFESPPGGSVIVPLGRHVWVINDTL